MLTSKPTTIKNRRDFLAATAHGRKFIVGCFILLDTTRAEDHPIDKASIRIGYTVTKKMGNAPQRTRIKRRLREAAKPALAKHGQPGHDYVVISRNKALACDFSELARDMEFAFSKIAANKGQT